MSKFDEKVNRINTSSVKYEEMDLKFGRADLMPFWVADMEFKAPQFMLDALKERVNHGIFGYTKRMPEYYDAVANWLDKRHGVVIQKSDLEYGPGVVFLLNMMIRLFTKPGEKILIQSPVYYPFKAIIEKNRRVVTDNVLVLNGDRYEIDFEDLRQKAQDPDCTMMLLCSPHNPVGRVWKEAELLKIAHICKENKVLLISDEIHFDLVYKPAVHYSLGKLGPEFDENVIVCTAPSKTFNIAGLHSAYCLIKNSDMMKTYREELGLLDLNRSNVFSRELTQVVYEQGASYVDELLAYIESNIIFAKHYIEKHIQEIKPMPMEATYLMWIDCKTLGLSNEALDDLFINKAKLALDSGYWFGDSGEGFMRLNLACPKSMLEEGLMKLSNAVKSIK
ncbi:MalY/PatB family protein [Fusibacter sp. 3D3]|uniref:MalY/PatB family protein n=1 Tax=Fusibacter sp. 3D3 TaxID=1048380 RepID=UPI00085347EA|nr:MalY/PatB family protein [Fusibacter sp. 3D3]GAU76567.1 aspartate aminotransferase [Fusibacter sp. 3D3]